MSNRILDVRLEDRCLDPVSAEVWITIRPEKLTATTELRGRLMGPTCPYSNTVEIAYPLMPLQQSELQEPGRLRSRVVIPEASLWDPQSPFLYSGPVELWQDGQRCDRVQVRHGLRRFSLGPQGLRVNSKRMSLEGQSIRSLTDAEALALRGQGCNLLLTLLRKETSFVWEMGDRLGFLVLGQADLEVTRSWELLRELSARPSCLGWILRPEDLPRVAAESISGSLLGCEVPVEGSHFQLGREGEDLLLRAGDVRIGRISAA